MSFTGTEKTIGEMGWFFISLWERAVDKDTLSSKYKPEIKLGYLYNKHVSWKHVLHESTESTIESATIASKGVRRAKQEVMMTMWDQIPVL